MDAETNGAEGSRIKGFSEIIGQDAAVGFLKRVLAGSKIPHAYLFTGIAGIGKTTTALAFTRAVNCLAPVGEDGCGRCLPCRQMEGGNFPDFERVRPDGRSIGIAQVRELTRRIGLKTVSARFRVSVIEQAETLTPEAANAFLKTLEEPPPGNILILDAQDKKDMLPTILSRCQKVSFRPVPAGTLSRWLHERHDVPLETADVLAGLSEGSAGRALRLAESTEIGEKRASHLEAITGLHGLSRPEVLDLAVRYARIEKSRKGSSDESDEGGLYGVLGLWKTCFRDMLLLKSLGSQELLIHGRDVTRLKKAAGHYTMSGLMEGLRILDRAQRDFLRARNLDLMMETTLLSLKRAAADAGKTIRRTHGGTRGG